jgi:predicted RNA binding protein YcfA (HicA-like mRNA interferase family)
MTRLPRVKGRGIVRALEKVDFAVDRTRGSHVFLKHSDGRATAAPLHSGETLGPGLLPAILRDVEMSVEPSVDKWGLFSIFGGRCFPIPIP